jgi:gamma-glutamyltranspeptidase/glutathione hydrolase
MGSIGQDSGRSGIGVPATGRRGMVATSQPAATEAGLAVLREGGNALDAAIAANAVLAVTEPHMCGLGGDLFAMVWDPVGRRLHGVNASGRSSAARDIDTLRALLGGASTLPNRGPHCVTVPGAVDGWALLHARFGRRAWPTLFEPAIALAREGFSVEEVAARWWRRAVSEVRASPGSERYAAEFFSTYAPGGAGPAAGERLRNPGLADSLEIVAREGRRGFYAGDLGTRLAATVAAAGGALTREDLAGPHAEWVAPISTRYRDIEVCALPPNGQGASVLQMLNILEGMRLPGPASVDWWHAFVEAKKLAFTDRARWYADPAFARAPLETLLSKDYAAGRRALIDPARARGDYGHGGVPGGDTTYLATADGDGMLVSLIQSIFNPFGSALVAPGTGFALQSRGAGFALVDGHPNVYAPGKRPFHTIMPGFALRDGRPWLVFGVVGADMQPQGQVQVLVNLVDFGCDVAGAAALPRVRHAGGPQPNGADEPGVGVVYVEPALPAAVVAGLRARGHVVAVIDDAIGNFVGGYQGILCDPAGGRYFGGSEPRFDGCARGF